MINHCPICGHQGLFEKFNNRVAAKCPGCLSLERHRLLWLYLENRTDLLSSGGSLLDIAPKKIFQARINQDYPECRYLSIDIRPGRAMLGADVMDLPLPSEAFDAVIAYHVLEHVANDLRAMAEIRRVLRPDGWGILQSPIDKRLAATEEMTHLSAAARLQRCGQADHLRRYGLDYAEVLESAGFVVEPDRYVETFTAPDLQRYGLISDEIIFLVRPGR